MSVEWGAVWAYWIGLSALTLLGIVVAAIFAWVGVVVVQLVRGTRR